MAVIVFVKFVEFVANKINKSRHEFHEMPIHFALVAPTCCGSGRASRREARARDPIDFHDLLEEAVEGRIPGGVLSLLREEALDCNPCRGGEGDPGEPHHYIWCLREGSG